MTATDELLARNATYRAAFDKGSLPLPPAKKVAVLACMDARLDPAKALGLEEGDADVIRNVGGVASEDAIRSLVISQRLLGTRRDHPHPPHRLWDGNLQRRRSEGTDLWRDRTATKLRPGGIREGRGRREADRGPHSVEPISTPKGHPWLRLRG